MADRFSIIVNVLKGYGEDSKKTTIIEAAKNLKTLKLDELIGSFLTHEMMSKEKEEKKKEVEKKNIGIALKSTKTKSDSSGDDEEKEMEMFAKWFKRLMKSNNGRRFQRREDFMNKNKEEENDQLICYECKKPGHMKVECPNLKKSLERKKHKNFVATWSDEDTSNDEDYVANLCLMAIEDDSVVTSNLSISIDYTFGELEEAYDELVLELESKIEELQVKLNDSPMEHNLKCGNGESIPGRTPSSRKPDFKVSKVHSWAWSIFFRKTEDMTVKIFTDSSWASELTDRRSTSGYCAILWGNLVTWRSKKQSVVSRSSVEAEYKALAQGICEGIWLQRLLEELGLKKFTPFDLQSDNQSAIGIAKNPIHHDRTKHVEIDRHFILEKVNNGEVTLNYIPTREQLADVLTKALPRNSFEEITSKLGLFNIYS
ncbi:hypothetical protein GQ457_17G007970 [Hibiscus cannabinus]